MPLNSSEFNHLDAATSLSRALQSEKIHYLFLAAMPQGLLGATGSPKYTFLLISLPKGPHYLTNIPDVNVVTEKDRPKLLLKRPGFTRSGDGKLVYDYCGTKVYVDVMGPRNSSWHIPDPQTTEVYNVNPEDRPGRRLNTSISDVHPSVLER